MDKRLRAGDRQAIDLLLERPDASEDVPPINQLFAQPLTARFEKRLESAEKLLNVLSSMPAAEPPMDLVQRTLTRIEEAAIESSSPFPSARPEERDSSLQA